jgi:hypothetical protein
MHNPKSLQLQLQRFRSPRRVDMEYSLKYILYVRAKYRVRLTSRDERGAAPAELLQ